MKTNLIRLLASLTLLIFSLGASAAPGGQLPLKIVTGEVEQVQLWGADTPAYRRLVDNPERLESAIAAQERHTDALMAEAGAIGTAVGWNELDEPVIKVYVDSNSSQAGIPETLDGIAVVVEQTGKLYALNVPCEQRDPGSCAASELQASAVVEPGPSEWHSRPVPIGVSASHFSGTAGTIGCRVNAGCHTYALSNAHVFRSGAPNDAILQPGPSDGGIKGDDTVANWSSSVPIDYSETASNMVDAAIAITGPSLVSRSTPADGYGTPRYNPLAPAMHLNVMKYGRTTGLTYGHIDGVNATLMIGYGSTNARFVGQLIIRSNTDEHFSASGDSGSLVVASGGPNERRPVALVFAAGGNITAANPISEVLSRLGVAIDGE